MIRPRTARAFLTELPSLLRFIRDDRLTHARLPSRLDPAPRGPASQRSREILLVCFSYRKDLEVLATSLRSLKYSGGARHVRFVLVSDRKAPYTDADVLDFERLLGASIDHLQTPHDHGHAGPYVFLNELAIFRRLAAPASPGTFIVKVDSDLLYLETSLLAFLDANCQHDYLFQDVRTTFDAPRWPSYAQGGCYAFRPHLVLRASVNRAFPTLIKGLRTFFAASRTVWPYWTLGEDILMYLHLSPFADAPLSTRFFVHCPYRPVTSNYQPPRFPSLMHFERCSHFMREYYDHTFASSSRA